MFRSVIGDRCCMDTDGGTPSNMRVGSELGLRSATSLKRRLRQPTYPGVS
jgi:hypothetical protein